ncbi:Omp28-related outer membrane protein [Bizionia paragorgiae]|uniref:Outer membrane protein Omp28 n=1 Tax=Bizionia paragorgiae TaxID=283786 RepID=A0A1H4BL71_BIZPA|nr:Omp28-related outer membrane protein [Bizionia paragorgiae]SEA48879.1 Outer membrane protein Omp28 [Bizionia paragorgiae]
MTLVIMAFSFTSCGSDDDGNSGEQLSSITLSSSANGGLVGDEFTFTVKDNNNNNITANAEIKVDGVIISNPHVFSSNGVYSVVATYSGKTSNALNIIIDQELSISMTYNPESVTNQDMVSFTVMNNLGVDVTSNTVLTLGGVEISNPYQFTNLGDNVVTASYSSFTTSETINVTRGFTKKVLLEDFTGTWCPNCPPAAASVSNVTSSYSNVFGVGYHDGVSGYPDPMEIPETAFWASYYNVTGFPTVYVNGPDTRWDFPGIAQINSELAEKATTGLSIDSEIVGGLLNLEVKVAFNQIPSEEVKLMLYLVEDNVTTSSPQAGSNQGANYVHKDVLRKVYSDQLGDVIPAGSISLSSDYTFSLTGVALPSNINDMNQLKIIAFVRNTYTKTFVDYFGTTHANSPHYDIYNVQEAEVGSAVGFD